MRADDAAFAVFACLGAVGCGATQTKLDAVHRLDARRFAACQGYLVGELCPTDPDCARHAAAMFVAVEPALRVQWLRDYGCPERLIRPALSAALDSGARGSSASSRACAPSRRPPGAAADRPER